MGKGSRNLHRPFALALLLLVACGGGGTGQAGPPPNIQLTHQFLIGDWAGWAYSVQGPNVGVSVRVLQSGGAVDRFPATVTFTGSPCFSSATGYIRPIPNTSDVEVVLGPISFSGTITTQTQINGAYLVTGQSPVPGCTGDNGDVILAKLAQLASPALLGIVEIHDTPEAFVRVVTLFEAPR